jgi:prolyl-tRNA synthetase
VQSTLLARATALRDEHTKKLETMEEFVAFFTPKNADKPEAHGGFALMHWAGSNDDEDQIAKDYKVTIRCIPLGDEYAEEGTCFMTGKPSSRRVVFAKSY